ncbi:nicotinate phosphoribosyltransferase [Spirulina sp. 06S082]|uniref:nicotinate phosphoribosyltransferase n=1 Tax=Spirulina sp. 06S082 TaxID=3110248 RepID=UPI002B203E60|nr:nicotinate phosphoribosyltransferase [Spirulina sp. 06S082]MEA5468862.1 nicotinate phosphoribosyltransferase [Spirulina sp. 06S082]
MTLPRPLTIAPEEYSLLTDLYQLTMTACYVGEGIEEKPASFELFARSLPPQFGYLIAMGLAQVCEYLQNLQFTSAQIVFLQETEIFQNAPDRFWQLLASSRFTGDIWAVAEGSAIFPHEPILRVEAPLWQAQLVETYLLNTVNYQTLIATRAARMRDIAGEKAKILEFGTRRAFSPQGAIWAARAALAGGLDGTSNVLAALKLGEKPVGTMAHALVMALGTLAGGDENEAFSAFARYFPRSPLLIDTYDTLKAAESLAKQVQAGEKQVMGVRLDSGDLVTLSQQVRSLLPNVPIFASGDLDEWEIARLQREGAMIDGYGIGTRLVTGTPVNGVYKLVEIAGIPTMKQSAGKATYPGRKQIFRTETPKIQDRLGLLEEEARGGERPLLELVIQAGQQIKKEEAIATIRQRTRASVASLPLESRHLEDPQPIPVEISARLQTLQNSLMRKSPSID